MALIIAGIQEVVGFLYTPQVDVASGGQRCVDWLAHSWQVPEIVATLPNK